jgi:hypothetical protein
MKYYKVIANGTVIDANYIWLRWQRKHNILIGCEPHEANYIQSYDQAQVWRVQWLNPVPADAPIFETIDAVEISEEEYLDLRSQLDSGLTPVEPEPEPEPEYPDPVEPEPEPEVVMTPEEMRRRIVELTEHNQMLEECLLEMSEVVYG